MNDKNPDLDLVVSETLPTANPKTPNSFITDFGPVLAYVLSFHLSRHFIDREVPFKIFGINFPGEDAPLYIGSLVFAVAILIAVIYSKTKTGKISLMLSVTAIIVFATVAITVVFKDPTVFMMKPTAINVLFGSAIFGSLAAGKNAFKLMFSEVYTLPDTAWRTLAIRWGLFFFFLAGVNEYVWRNYSVDFWTNFKLLGMLPITFVFTLLNVPLLMKYMSEKDTP